MIYLIVNTKDMNRNYKSFLRKILLIFAALTIFVASINPVMAATKLSAKQRNSINMLNHLAYITGQINNDHKSRAFLDQVYSRLIDDTNPNVVDIRTQAEYEAICNTLHDYSFIDTKRERLSYLYDQSKAQNVRALMPNPLGLLSSTASYSLPKLVSSLSYMVVDSISSYSTANNAADMKYLEENWNLDDKEQKAIYTSREGIFDYMVDTVRAYKLPEGLTLSESDISNFIIWKDKGGSETKSKIRWLTSNKKTYQNFGPYWLVLADAYYSDKQYKKCISSISKYEKTDYSGIFRWDYNFADTLIKGIASANYCLKGKKYISTVEHYLSLIDKNTKKTDGSDWKIRYFAAQTNIDLYSRTKQIKYLNEAYNIALDNVNLLADEQRDQNKNYLEKVKKESAKKDMTKEQKQEISAMYKMMVAKRKTELPPVNEPLALNCDMLYSLENKLKKSNADKKKVDVIVHRGGTLFLNTSIKAAYTSSQKLAINKGDISMEPGSITSPQKLVVPAKFVSDKANIIFTVTEGGKTTTYSDWKLSKVKRGKEGDINTFYATYESEKAKHQKYTTSSKVVLTIKPHGSSMSDVKSINVNFKVKKDGLPLIKNIVYKFEVEK